MKLTTENMKKACIINSLLIVIAIALRITVFTKINRIAQTESVVCILALLFGLIYSLNGYKKDSAKYYMTFMILLALNSIVSLCGPISETINGTITFLNTVFAVVEVLVLVCTFMLAFGENLGKAKSTKISYVLLLLEVVKAILALANGITTPMGLSSVSFLIQGFIVCLLVNAKYEDKESRGAR